jgi:hypothetical protein
MFRRTLTLAAGCAALAGATVFVPAAGAAEDNGAGKASLVQHVIGLDCVTGTTTGGSPQDGFAIIKQNSNFTVQATVSLENGPANAAYDVAVSRTPAIDCFGALIEAVLQPGRTLETNSHGNGNAHVDLPQILGTTGAFVFLVPQSRTVASGIIASEEVPF